MTRTIILHHGIFGGGIKLGPMRVSVYRNVARMLSDKGYSVVVSDVHPCTTVARRAGQLKDWILKNRSDFGPGKLTIIAHSMGGLDARYMLSRLEMSEHVDTLLTISTPHRGSACADWWVKRLKIFPRTMATARRLGIDVEGVFDLTIEGCAAFNREIPDSPDVNYFSVSAACPRENIPLFARLAFDNIHQIQGPNDGMVAVLSSTWGTHLETWPNNHWQQINRSIPRPPKGEVFDITPRYVKAIEAVMNSQPQ